MLFQISDNRSYQQRGDGGVLVSDVWLYNCWQVEENIQAHAQRVLNLIKQIVEDELKEYAEDLQGLYQNPITVWQPDNGEVQAEIRLPMDVSRLDQVPDMSPLINQISAQMPDMKISKELKKFRSSEKMGKRRKHKVRKFKN
ncbi:hypothetical protein RRG08_035236 [Elysia crispata]|uniref:Uncharacterized protein n=1 Tax=Elysia crispata TaxID=231223 RepID=A0AAE0ZNR7_9GAST|nr:hypothetical protein RRG08_035236 [Elysia crispata]